MSAVPFPPSSLLLDVNCCYTSAYVMLLGRMAILIRRRKKGRWGDPFLTYVSMREAPSNAENSPATEKAMDQGFFKKNINY